MCRLMRSLDSRFKHRNQLFEFFHGIWVDLVPQYCRISMDFDIFVWCKAVKRCDPGIRGFSLDRVLESDAGFLKDDQDHQHDQSVSSALWPNGRIQWHPWHPWHPTWLWALWVMKPDGRMRMMRKMNMKMMVGLGTWDLSKSTFSQSAYSCLATTMVPTHGPA